MGQEVCKWQPTGHQVIDSASSVLRSVLSALVCAEPLLVPRSLRQTALLAVQCRYPYVCHAEMNAIMNKNTASLAGAVSYTFNSVVTRLEVLHV